MSMLSDIVEAFTDELKTFMAGYNGTVILDTELKEDFAANFPLAILSFESAPESARLPGTGTARMDWDISIRVYAFEPNAYVSDDGGTSASLLAIIDDLRVWFQNEAWANQDMIDLTTNYAFRMEYQGTVRAEDMNTNAGICMGYKHTFASIALDLNTKSTTDTVDNAGSVSGSVVFN